jgi:hypothetical protein
VLIAVDGLPSYVKAFQLKLSAQITKQYFGGDFAKFHQWWIDNAMAATMEVLPSWKV